MVHMEKVSKSLVISLSFYLVYVFMPVTRLLPSALKAGFIMFALLFFICHLLNKRSKLLISTFLCCIGLVAVDFLIYYGVWRDNDAVVLFDKSLMLFVFWMPLLYAPAIMISSSRTKKYVFIIFLSSFFVEMTTTMIGNIVFPMASRTLASTQDLIQNRLFQAANIGGYGFIYAMTFALPLWFYLYRSFSKKYILPILFSLLTVALASYMTAITLSILGLLFSFAIKNRKALFVGLITIAIIFIFKDFFLNALNTLSEMAYSSDNHILGERISNIRGVLMKEEASGDLGYRDELRNSSIMAFWASPLLGNLVGDFRTLGLHSEFVDWLGGLGLLGFLFIILVILPRIKKYLSYFRQTALKRYLYITFAMCFAFGFLNVITTAPEISSVMFIFPLTILGKLAAFDIPQKKNYYGRL